jgi:hypothetical protein
MSLYLDVWGIKVKLRASLISSYDERIISFMILPLHQWGNSILCIICMRWMELRVSLQSWRRAEIETACQEDNSGSPFSRMLRRITDLAVPIMSCISTFNKRGYQLSRDKETTDNSRENSVILVISYVTDRRDLILCSFGGEGIFIATSRSAFGSPSILCNGG